MSEKIEGREELVRELDECSSRLQELKGKAKSQVDIDQLDVIAGELKSCKLELGEVEHRSDDDWAEAKHGVVRRLNEARNSLNLSARKMI